MWMDTLQAEEAPAENKHKAWQKPVKGKKKVKAKKAKPAFQWKKNVQNVTSKTEQEKAGDADNEEVSEA